jgi:transcriptional regulator GlxA family with amidase domain
MTRTVIFVIYDGFQLLDLAGPMTVFEIAGRFVPNAYHIETMAENSGPIVASSGLVTVAEPAEIDNCDTLVVVGGSGIRRAIASPGLLRLVGDVAVRARRVTSVCSGSLILAAAGLLDDRKATTHWRRAGELARNFRQVSVVPDRIFVRDGHVWTSAGITAGIDLALALVADDLGAAVAARIAKEMVVPYRRPGGQSQFSTLSELPVAADRIGAALAFARENLGEDLPVERLAAAANLSPRQFARAFRAATGTTPAKAVEQLRVEAARAAIEAGGSSIDIIASATGFGDQERMRRAFLRLLGQPPQALRRAAKATDWIPPADSAMPTRPT